MNDVKNNTSIFYIYHGKVLHFCGRSSYWWGWTRLGIPWMLVRSLNFLLVFSTTPFIVKLVHTYIYNKQHNLYLHHWKLFYTWFCPKLLFSYINYRRLFYDHYIYLLHYLLYQALYHHILWYTSTLLHNFVIW